MAISRENTNQRICAIRVGISVFNLLKIFALSHKLANILENFTTNSQIYKQRDHKFSTVFVSSSFCHNFPDKVGVKMRHAGLAFNAWEHGASKRNGAVCFHRFFNFQAVGNFIDPQTAMASFPDRDEFPDPIRRNVRDDDLSHLLRRSRNRRHLADEGRDRDRFYETPFRPQFLCFGFWPQISGKVPSKNARYKFIWY
jgi:hypothetical protein